MWAILIEHNNLKRETWKRAMKFQNRQAYFDLRQIIDRISDDAVDLEEDSGDNSSSFEFTKQMPKKSINLIFSVSSDSNHYMKGTDWLFNEYDVQEALELRESPTLLKTIPYDYPITVADIAQLHKQICASAEHYKSNCSCTKTDGSDFNTITTVESDEAIGKECQKCKNAYVLRGREMLQFCGLGYVLTNSIADLAQAEENKVT